MPAKRDSFEEYHYRAPVARLSMQATTNGDWKYRTGWWRSREGRIVIVTTWERLEPMQPVTLLEYFEGGYQHVRRWTQQFGDRTLSRLAREFVEDIHHAR